MKPNNIKSELERTNLLLNKNLTSLRERKGALLSTLNNIQNARAFKLWQSYNNLKKLTFRVVPKIKKLASLSISDRTSFKIKIEYYFAYLSRIKMPLLNRYESRNRKHNPKKNAVKVDIVIPWYGDEYIYPLLTALSNKSSLVNSVVIVNDCYPDQESNLKLEKYTKTNYKEWAKVVYTDTNSGFPKAVNTGIKLTKNDTIIMNSDTLPIGDWLEEMIDASQTDEKIASVTPLSNNATIFSIPKPNISNTDLEPDITAKLLKQLLPTSILDVPTAHGFCMLLKRKYLDNYGLLDEKTYGKGYGEENDLCMRYSKAGLRNVVATKAYVLHYESQSFGSKQRRELISKNYKLLLKAHPEYEEQVFSFLYPENPLEHIHHILSNLKSKYALLSNTFTLVIVHKNPYTVVGGVEREVLAMLKKYRNLNKQSNVLIYFHSEESCEPEICLLENFKVKQVFTFPKGTPSINVLNWILDSFSVKNALVEHLFGHDIRYGKRLCEKGVVTHIFVHDYYYLSQIPDLVSASGEYFGLDLPDEKENKYAKEIYGKSYVDKTQWRRGCKELLSQYTNKVIFNSEFTKKIYLDIYGMPENEKFVVSYPEFE